MAKQREISSLSDEVLMNFMNRMEDFAKSIQSSVADVTTNHTKLEERVDNHIKHSFTINTYIAIIIFLIGIISGLLGYIWGKDDKNERIQERTERPLEKGKGD